MPHQRTYTGMNPQCDCEKQEYQVFHAISNLQHKHDQCKCWSITKETFFKPILNIRHFTYHLAVYMWSCNLFLIQFQNSKSSQNSKIYPKYKNNYISRKRQSKSVYKYSKVRERNKMHICSLKVKDIKWALNFETF